MINSYTGKILTGTIAAFLIVAFYLLACPITALILTRGFTTPFYSGPNGNALYRIEKAVPDRISVSEGTVRTVTAYNVGDRRQTHSKPCIGASGDNLCSLVRKGIKVCAANFVPLRTKLHVATIGECIVLDRMNSRFGSRVDFAMEKGQHNRAVKFGVQRLGVIESEE